MQLVSSRETYHRITGARAKLSCALVWRDVVAVPVKRGQGVSALRNRKFETIRNSHRNRVFEVYDASRGLSVRF
jgi:hypothetical protein